MMKISIVIVAISLIAATVIQVSGGFVPPQGGRNRLFKRSLCNTFGGCGAKRSITPQMSDYKLSDESSEMKRHDADAKLITEILEDIIEHLKKDQDYRRGKYVMFVPKQTIDGTNYLQPLDANDGLNGQQQQQPPIDNNIRNSLEDDYQANRV